jgi:hypothetical protein
MMKPAVGAETLDDPEYEHDYDLRKKNGGDLAIAAVLFLPE